MKRRDFMNISAASALLTAAGNGCSILKTAHNSRHLVVSPESRAKYLAKMLKAICTDIGPHPIGSPEYDKASLIVKKEMELALPKVEFDTFMYDRWVLLNEPEFYVGKKRLEAYPYQDSPGTPPDGIVGILRRADDNAQTPYEVLDRSSGEIKAYIVLSFQPNIMTRSYKSVSKISQTLPVFNVAQQDRAELDIAVKNKTPVTLNAQVDIIPETPTSNVVGTLPGKSTDECVFIAHLDTVYISPGANDNTATLIIMLMWAHALSGTRPKKTLTFLTTTGEEVGFWGAKNYVETRKKEGTLNNIKFVFNFDSFTWGPNISVISKDEELRSLVQQIDRELNILGMPVLRDDDGFWLDARPFSETGARALSISSDGDVFKKCWHQKTDILENVPVEYVENNFLLFHEFIKRLQNL